MKLILHGGTVIDAVREVPLADHCILIEDGCIRAIHRSAERAPPPDAEAIDCTGMFIIPGLLNANVHLMMDIRLETLARHEDDLEDLIIEAAQIAIVNGVTTVFDTWGPRRPLCAARDRIASGGADGSRIFFSGNIVGLDGPFSQDFLTKASEVASAAMTRRINALWAENVGRHLLWQTPERVAEEVRRYVARGVDFLKYASNGHGGANSSAFLAFSEATQRAIVDEGRKAGITVQAHTTTVEGLRIAVEAGCDLIQHANITGPVEIPAETLALLAGRGAGAVVFPFTAARLSDVMARGSDADRTLWGAADANVRHIIECGAPLLMANDGFVWSRGMLNDPMFNRAHTAPGDDNLFDLASGHFAWFRAMEEKGCPPIEILRAATRNVANAYGLGARLGTIEEGKIADLVVLRNDPLKSAGNYRDIQWVIKDGRLVDRDNLPSKPILTRDLPSLSDEEEVYIPFLAAGSAFPTCPLCLCH